MNRSEDFLYLTALALCLRHKGGVARQLLDYYGTARTVMEQDAAVLTQHPGITPALASALLDPALPEEAQRQCEWAAAKNVKMVTLYQPEYPYRLRECADAPVMLFVVGPLDLNQSPVLAVVGTRSATPQGRELCTQLIEGLARTGLAPVIVSGLAFGIDICAHKAALQTQLPTIAVLPTGIDRIYPTSHRPIAKEIAKTGAVLSEFPPQTAGLKNNFLQRNRIIAGLADATLVVESKQDGGALITAHLASDYGRDVLAVPGRPADLCSMGCNRLIRSNKAALVTSTQDIVDALGWQPVQAVQTSLFDSLTEEEKALLVSIQEFGGTLNDIHRRVNIPIPTLSAQLSTLEIKGVLRRLPNGEYALPQ